MKVQAYWFDSGSANWVAVVVLAIVLGSCRSSAPVVPDPDTPLQVQLSAAPTSGAAPLTVDFTATATGGNSGTLQLDYDFDGDGIFDLLDGGATPQRTYSVAGDFNATVRASDATPSSDTALIVIHVSGGTNATPTAVVTANPSSGNAPLLVHFDAAASSDSDGSIIQYDYDFDANGIWDAYDAAAQVDWTYSAHGDYTVRLRVTDNGGAENTTTLAVHVNAPPTAVLTASATTVNAGDSVDFDASGSSDADGSSVRYEWDADGNGTFELDRGTNPALQVLFPVAGSVVVAVRVTDTDGATDIETLTIQVAP
jgi:PKD repeat protein